VHHTVTLSHYFVSGPQPRFHQARGVDVEVSDRLVDADQPDLLLPLKSSLWRGRYVDWLA